MNKKKKLIVICIFIITIIIIGLSLIIRKIIIQNNKSKVISDNKIEDIINITEGEISSKYKEDLDITNEKKFFIDKELDYLKDYEEFYIVNECLNSYIDYVVNDHNWHKALFVLDESYKKNHKDLYEYIEERHKEHTKGNYAYRAEYMKSINKDAIHIYFVYGNIIEYNKETYEKNIVDKYDYIVKIDYNTGAYSIIPDINITQEEFKGLIRENIINNYNKIELSRITPKIKLEEYIKYYWEELNLNIQKAYERLDKEYCQKRFNNDIEEFKEFVKKYYYTKFDTKIILNNMYVSEDEVLANMSQYIYGDEYDEIKDNFLYNNNFVIKEIASNMFEILLDRYTVITDSIKKEYYSLTDNEKAIYNCKNIINSIQTDYYEYVYEHLSDSTKQEQYKTYEEFESYLTNNSLEGFYSVKKNETKKINNNTYIYETTLNNMINNDEKNVKIEILLGDNMDFKILSIQIIKEY